MRREQILATTVELVTRQGFDGVRAADVADVLGISSALVFYHFETKDRLLADALEYAVDQDMARLDRTVRGSTDAVGRLRRVLRLYAPTSSAPGWPLWIDAWGSALRSPTMRATLRRLDDRWRDAIVQVIAEGVESGEFVCPDPEGTARRLMGVMDGMAVQQAVHRELSLRRMAEFTRVAAALELGISPDALA